MWWEGTGETEVSATLLADMEYSSSLVRKLVIRFYRRWIVAIKG